MKKSNFSLVLREIALDVFFYMLVINSLFLLGMNNLLLEILIAITLTFVLRYALYLHDGEFFEDKNR
ncbi:MAG: hypothetical protein CVV25_04190 [Ignavibacteriae bacterium HGW-Ignavibacteriae-4]|jgi:hypothetical protein|nr:MAG: hypothetical protein CVV25_04190 [Ignavibacteriae bacterium HGW-Ignavibacteriae-4]